MSLSPLTEERIGKKFVRSHSHGCCWCSEKSANGGGLIYFQVTLGTFRVKPSSHLCFLLMDLVHITVVFQTTHYEKVLFLLLNLRSLKEINTQYLCVKIQIIYIYRVCACVPVAKAGKPLVHMWYLKRQ